jgi:hypothetical protein
LYYALDTILGPSDTDRYYFVWIRQNSLLSKNSAF